MRILNALDEQQRELNASELYQQHLENMRQEKIAAQVAEAARLKAEKAKRPDGQGAIPMVRGKKKKTKSRNTSIMKAVNLRVEFVDDVYTFRIPWDYTMKKLHFDCCTLWRVDPSRFVLEDGFDNVWPEDAIVTSEVKPVVGVQDDFDRSPKLVLVDKEVALSMFDRETAEEKAAKRAASMISTEFIGPVPETLVEKSIRERTDLAEELGPYLIFLFVFMGCIMMKRNVYASWVMTDGLKEYFTGESFPSEYKPNVNFAFGDIANSEEMYQWMVGVFLGGIEDTITLRYNKVIGGFQVRTIKIKQGQNCYVPSDYGSGLGSSTCYGPWLGDHSQEDTASYADVKYRTDHILVTNNNGTITTSLNPKYPTGQLTKRYYWNKNNVNTLPITSSATRLSYGPDGYFINIPMDDTFAAKAVAEFEASAFTDGATRAVIVTMLLFNQNYNLFDHVNFLFEFDPGGVVTPTMYQKTFRMDTYGEPGWFLRFLFDALYAWFIVLLYKNIVLKIHLTYLKTSSYLAYFANAFNAFDFAIAGVSTVYITFECMNAFNSEKRNFKIETTTYTELGIIGQQYELGAQLNAFCAFLVVLRTFEYLAISEPVQHLIRTLGLAAPECVSFTIMFLIIFYSFALMAHIVFGFINPEFSALSFSTITLLIMQLGEFDYGALVEANSFYAPIFFIMFNIVIVFVLLNVFVGIIADAYEAAKHIDNDPEKDYLPSAGTLFDDLAIMYNGIGSGIYKTFAPGPPKRDLAAIAAAAEEERLAQEAADEEERRMNAVRQKIADAAAAKG